MKKLIVLLLMILPLGAIAQEVKIAYVKTQEVFMAMPAACAVELGRVWMPKADKQLVLFDKNNAVDVDDAETITIKHD